MTPLTADLTPDRLGLGVIVSGSPVGVTSGPAAVATVRGMTAWAGSGRVELPFGDAPRSWWIDASGSLYDRPVAGADPLPGRFILPGSAGGMTLEIPPGPGTPMLPAAGRFLAPAGRNFLAC